MLRRVNYQSLIGQYQMSSIDQGAHPPLSRKSRVPPGRRVTSQTAQEKTRLRRRLRRRRLAAGVDIDPGFEARGERRLDPHVSRDLIFVGMGKFGVRDLEQCAWHAILAAPREGDDRMMRLAARAHDFGIVDPNYGPPVADERVADASKAAAESRELTSSCCKVP